MSCFGVSSSCLPTCLGGSADPRWQHVYVKEVNPATGQFKRDLKVEARRGATPLPLPTQDAAQPLLPTPILELHYLEDTTTGEFYLYDNHNGGGDTFVKCVLIGLFSPFYAGAVIAVDIFRTLIAIAKVVVEAFSNLAQDFAYKGFCETLGNFVYNLANGTVEYIWPPVRQILMTPLFWVALEVGCLIGLFSPFDGRAFVARVQSAWFDGATFRDDPRYRAEHRARDANGRVVLNGEDCENSVCFIAWCFLPRGTRNEQIEFNGNQMNKYEVVRTAPLC